ncbi:MAG: sugar phosphate isomerase/epimerase [Atribacterota bacterium]|nr:sugar phosphate isomerase/epimerase [Atribacterota bacterium]
MKLHNGIEINNYELWDQDGFFAETGVEIVIKNLLPQMETAGIIVGSLHAPFKKDCIISEDEYESYFMKFQKCCKKGKAYKAKYLVIHPPVIAGEENITRDKEEIHLLKKSLSLWLKMGKEAGVYGLDLAFENMPPSQGWPSGCNWEMSLEIIKILKQPNIKTCLDISHCFVNKQIQSILTELNEKNLPVGIHVSDGIVDSRKDCHLPPGEGDLDWLNFFAVLQKNKYKRNLVIEVNSPYLGIDLLQKIISFLQKNIQNYN